MLYFCTNLDNLNGGLFWTLQLKYFVDMAGNSLVIRILGKFQWGSPHIYQGPYSGMSQMYSLLRKNKTIKGFQGYSPITFPLNYGAEFWLLTVGIWKLR